MEGQVSSMPTSLVYLDLSGNALTGLSAPLPHAIKYISLNDNKIVKLPKKLPTSIQYINLKNNWLDSLPKSIFSMPKDTEIHLNQNPLSVKTILKLNKFVNKTNFIGPKFFIKK
ncbi:MAG: hypothetical protein EKE20_06255 [Candidatus Symbiopectobacterium sp. Dall1.0]|nr:hypothetical protein [Candidatus Symbiopectobacterium sp. Dall1.0]